MARPLETRLPEELHETDDRDSGAVGRLDLAAARAFAAALAALIIASLVVTQSARSLEYVGTAAANNLEAGTITLTDDDRGRSLIDLRSMAPGRPVQRCLAVTYEGTILPVDLSLRADSNGSLASFIEVRIERGTGGSFDSCDDFEPAQVTFEGTAAELVAMGALPSGRLYNRGDVASFRFRYELRDDMAAIGRSAAVDLLWEATPS